MTVKVASNDIGLPENHDTRPFIRRDDAAKYVRDRHGVPLARNTLAKLACIGGGPKFCKAGRIPLYREDWLDEWVMARVSPPVHSTSELAA